MNDDQVIYAFARAEQFLEDYARSNALPAHELTRRVAELLFRQTNGQILGAQNRVPGVRGNGAARDQSLEQVALAHRAHNGEPRQKPLTGNAKRVSKYAAQGYNAAQIARKLKMTSSGVYYLVRAYNIPIRVRGEANGKN